ncbi:hypothetical protein F5B20DRAFT_577119 [Whalleya microplaca]|nr:hypothetical protein F5B20DRAFT_577119 [Whalleya microplaca]
MSSASSSGKGWTDAEKFNFLIQVVDQLTENGAKLNYSKLNMPNRTEKAMKHMMEKVRAMATEYRNNASGAPTTPVKPGKKSQTATPSTAASRKRKVMKIEGDDDENELSDATPVKKARRTPAKKVKEEVTEADGDKEENGTASGAGALDGEI